MHAARQTRADDNPDKSRRVSPLRRQHRPDQWTRTRNGREVVTEEHEAIGRVIINTVLQSMRRRETGVVEHRDFRRQKGAVVAIRHGKRRQRPDNQPQGIHRGNFSQICW